MKGPIVYYCEECGKTRSVDEGEELPTYCCDRKMKKQESDFCTKSGSSAEHARFDDDDEPCDEGR